MNRNHDIVWTSANVLGVVGYLFLASSVWAPKGEEGVLGGPGDPIIWTLYAFPILVIFFFVNVVWLILIVIRLIKQRQWKSVLSWVACAAVWAAALGYDRSRQYTGVDIHPPATQAPNGSNHL